MLTIFGRIRRQLLRDGVMLKYLAYGVGEVVLIIIGILLAIEISEWNAQRNHRIEQRQLMERLVVAVRRDQEIPIGGVIQVMQRTIDTVRLIEADLRKGEITEEAEYALIMYRSDPRSIVRAEFAELRGEISDQEVAAKLGGYLAYFESATQYYESNTKVILHQVSQQINGLLEYETHDGYAGVEGVFDEVRFMQKYRTDVEFRGTVYRLYLNSRSTYSFFSNLKGFSDEFLVLLESKLAEQN